MTTIFVPGQTLAAASVNQDLAWPTASVIPFAGSTTPVQGATSSPYPWLLCDGTEYSQSIYATLFAQIGSAFNTGGETAGFFRVPDMRGRVPAGADNMGGSAASRLTSGVSGVDGATLGAAGGDQNLHQHTHTQNAHAHSYSDPGHFHSVLSYAGGGGPDTVANWTVGGASYARSSTFGTSGRGYTGISISNATATNQNTGSGSSQNVQPTLVLNYLIKT